MCSSSPARARRYSPLGSRFSQTCSGVWTYTSTKAVSIILRTKPRASAYGLTSAQMTAPPCLTTSPATNPARRTFQVTVVFGETQPGGKHLAHRTIAVEHRDNATTFLELSLERLGDRGFPGSRQPSKPDAKSVGDLSLRCDQVDCSHCSTPSDFHGPQR